MDEVGSFGTEYEGGVADGMMNVLISELLDFMYPWFYRIILPDPSRRILHCQNGNTSTNVPRGSQHKLLFFPKCCTNTGVCTGNGGSK